MKTFIHMGDLGNKDRCQVIYDFTKYLCLVHVCKFCPLYIYSNLRAMQTKDFLIQHNHNTKSTQQQPPPCTRNTSLFSLSTTFEDFRPLCRGISFMQRELPFLQTAVCWLAVWYLATPGIDGFVPISAEIKWHVPADLYCTI